MDSATDHASILLACSQGSRVAIDFTLAHPERVRGLILLSSAVSGAPPEPVPDDIRPLDDALDAAEEADDIDRMNAIEAHIWLDGPRSAENRVHRSAEGPVPRYEPDRVGAPGIHA